MLTAKAVIDALGLAPLPVEGGSFRRAELIARYPQRSDLIRRLTREP